jgi:flotillin
VASSDLVNMGITVVSYTLKDVRDDEVNHRPQLCGSTGGD